MKSFDFIKEAKTQAIGFRKWIKDGQDVWQIIRPDGKIETVPRGFLEQQPKDVTYVAWNPNFTCPPGFQCSPQADNSPAPNANTPVATNSTPKVDVSGTTSPPAPMSTAHIDIAAKSQGAGNKPPATSVAGGRGTSTPPPVSSSPAQKPYAGSTAAQAIQKLNPQIKDINKIYVGQELNMPDGSKYRVVSGDTLDKIASGRGRGTMSGTVTNLPPNQQVDFADIQKTKDKKLLESLSPVEQMQQLRSLVEAPAPNPRTATRTSSILGPDGKPIRVPTSTTQKPSPTASTYIPPSSSVSQAPAPGSTELYFGDRFYRKIGTQWHEINLADGSKKPVPDMQAALDKLAAGPKKPSASTAQPQAAAQAQSSIQQGINAAKKPAPDTTSAQYYDRLNAIANAKGGPNPNIGYDELDPDKGIKVDPETAKRIRGQMKATGTKFPTKAGMSSRAMAILGFLSGLTASWALSDVPGPVALYQMVKDWWENKPPAKTAAEQTTDENIAEATKIWEKEVLPYLNNEASFNALPLDKQERIKGIHKMWIEVIADPTKTPTTPPWLK